MARFLWIPLMWSFVCSQAQNNLIITSFNGTAFEVAEPNVTSKGVYSNEAVLYDLFKDTVRVKLSFEDKQQTELTFYLLDKGKKTSGKDFEYQLVLKNNKWQARFLTMRPTPKVPALIVPSPPKVDTSKKIKNGLLGHLCEVKNGKIIYFDNIPGNGKCTAAMPDEYLTHVAMLMKSAQVSDDRFVIVDQVTLNNCFSTAQLNRLFGYIDFELEKLKILKSSYYNLVDPQNRNDIKKNFRFEASLKEIDAYLKDTTRLHRATSANCVNAAGEESIKIFRESLAIYNNDGQRMEFFKKNYKNYCYSVPQIKSLLLTFIHDREKLDGSRLLYHYCIQKNDYAQLKDVFSYNQSASELDEFILRQGR